MKRILFIIFMSLFSALAAQAQVDDQPDDRGSKLLQRMQEYIQRRLNMTPGEAERFSPIFLRYITDLRRTHREFKMDRPVLQLKIAELRVRYRDEWRQILNEQRANRVFDVQREFEDHIRQEIMERRQQGRGGTLRRNRTML